MTKRRIKKEQDLECIREKYYQDLEGYVKWSARGMLKEHISKQAEYVPSLKIWKTYSYALFALLDEELEYLNASGIPVPQDDKRVKLILDAIVDLRTSEDTYLDYVVMEELVHGVQQEAN